MRLFLPCISVALLTACGGNDPQTTPDTAVDAAIGNDTEDGPDATPADTAPAADIVDPAPTIAAFCDTARTTLCSWFAACRPNAPFACEAWPMYQQLELACAIATAPDARESVAIDLSHLERCAATLNSVDCSTNSPPIALETCRPLGTPRAADGEPCHSPTMFLSQCDGGICNLRDSCPGRCENFLAVGDSCGSGTRVCDPFEAFCFDGQCRAMSEVGGSCEPPGHMCRTELRCDPIDLKCRDFIPENGDCTSTEACAAGLACADGTCRAKVASGQGCRNDANCPEAHQCSPNDVELVCKPLAAENAPCGPDGGAACARGLSCANPDGDSESWICRAPGTDGDTCSNMYCAEGFWCNMLGETPVCRTRGARDAACPIGSVGMDSCQDGLFCLNERCAPPSGLDGPCEPGMPGTCEDAFWCKDGTCAAPADSGADCDNGQPGSCGAGLWCSPDTLKCIDRGGADATCSPGTASCRDGFHCACNLSDDICGGPNAVWTCVTDKSDGTPCRDNPECASGYCDFGQDPAVCSTAPQPTPVCEP